jgi:tetratricopeptide (TPR) repeat protein
MRLIFLIIIFFGCSLISHAQRSKVISVFQLIETAKYDEAKKAIEEAITDEKTMEWPKTWYARGLLCQTAYEKKKTELYPDQLFVAFDSYEKALSLDSRGRIEAQVAPRYTLLANEFQKVGERSFSSRKYKDALSAFEKALQINRSPILSVQLDTSLVYNTALAAYEAKEWEKATGYLSILHKDNYSPNVSHLLYTVYLEQRDTLSAKRVLMEGINNHKKNEELVLLLVDLLFQTDDSERAIIILDSVSSANPSKYIFPYTKGLVYQKTSKYREAIIAYEEAVNLAPDEIKIYANIGTCYYNIGVEIDENARAIAHNRTFLEEKAKSVAAFESAVEWLEKAFEKEPKNQQIISKLYQLYNALLITDKTESLKNQIR